MKKIILTLMTAAVVVCSGCNKKGNNLVYYDATVTFKQTTDGGCFMELDDETALVASNMQKYPFQKPEQRALVFYGTDNTSPSSGIPGYKKTINAILQSYEATLTKDPVPSLGSEEADAKTYGNDAVGLYLDGVFPVTMIEDGYLSVSMNYMGGGQAVHIINLVSGVNPDDPYEVELRHSAEGDTPFTNCTALVAFPLKNLPDTGGKTVKLTLKWNSMVTGKKESVAFDYCSRTDWPQ